jgi:hypothetical protein
VPTTLQVVNGYLFCLAATGSRGLVAAKGRLGCNTT